jgi:hypothetical protein
MPQTSQICHRMTALWSVSSRQRRKTTGSGLIKLQGESGAMDSTTTRDVVCGGKLSTDAPTGPLPDCSRGYFNKLDATAEKNTWTNFIWTNRIVKFLTFSVLLSLSLIQLACWLIFLLRYLFTPYFHILFPFFNFLSSCLVGLYFLANSLHK